MLATLNENLIRLLIAESIKVAQDFDDNPAY